MNITILAVGRIKEAFYRQAIEEFRKRLGRYCKLTIIEVADEKTPDPVTEAAALRILAKEGARLLKYIKENDYICALAIEGDQPNSVTLAKKLEQLTVDGKSNLVFMIGGSLGLWEQLIHSSHWRLSFSNMTFPHQLMRVILLEQLYRSFRIIQGEPYHK